MTKSPKSTQAKRYPVSPVEALEPKDGEYAKAINKHLAHYRRTDNVLALWAALRICIQEDRPLPTDLKPFFLNIAEKLLTYSAESERAAREFVADLVLGTLNQGGGRSVFQNYLAEGERNRLFDETHAELIAQGVIETTQPFSQQKVYEKIADKWRVSVEKVRKEFEAREREAGSFSVGALRRAKRRPGGIKEL